MSKLAIVTGGSSGIGLATLDKFLRNDYQVINLSRKPSRLTDCLNIPVDLSDDDFIEKVSGRLIPLVEAAATIVLVHNAGVHSRDSAVAVDVDSLRQALAVNVIAPALLNKLLLPSMKQGSSVIYIGSTLSEKAVAGCCSYITSKHAVVGLMKSTCQDAAGMGIHTACICPGFTETEMLKIHVGGSENLAEIAGMSTFGRLISPIEIADMICFCAENAVINGSVIHANLGQVER